MVVTVQLDEKQLKHHDRLVLGIGDCYEYIMRRLYEAERDDDMRIFEHEFCGAGNIYVQAQVIQDWRKKVQV